MGDDTPLVELVWYGAGAWPRAARALLTPAELAYRAGTALRGALYDRGVLATHRTAVPAISVGNLTVGGTGKTPVAAWLARTLRERGARPAVVLRGYGGDEVLVHRSLNPAVEVIVAPDRVAGALEARARGCDVTVLDDAFQHRRAARVVDLVVVSAERYAGARRLLPAGPWREGVSALRRATAVVVTRKAASAAHASAVAEELSRAARIPVVQALLAPRELRSAAGDASRPLSALVGRDTFVIAAIGDPTAFAQQMEALGARVTLARFPDHHGFSDAEVAALSARAARSELAVCTLKDAVKLASRWPRAGSSLWYVSQRVAVEQGEAVLQRALDVVLAARPHSPTSTAGADRPTQTDNGH